MLTEYRMRTSEYSTEIGGSAWEHISFIRVDFIWLVLPAFVYVSITFVLFSTVYQSAMTDVPTWKHTSLGLIRALQGEKAGTVMYEAKESAKVKVMQLVVHDGHRRLHNIDDMDKYHQRI
jgi:hypothetical protein